MTRTRQLADRQDREKAAGDLAGSFLVEAAAGTGKTTLLVDRILNLVKEKKALPEEIVAITFTERAAADLKAKLQSRLGEEAAGASGKAADDLAEALSGLERMQVTTIHSFCASILKERPVEAGIDPNFAVADELMASLVSQEIWDEWIAREMDRDNQALRRALHIGITLDHMHQLALAISANRDVADYLPEPGRLEAGVAAFIEGLRAVNCRLEKAAGSCNRPDDNALCVIRDLARSAREVGRIDDEGRLQAYILNSISIPAVRTLGNSANWASADHLKEVRQDLGNLRERHAEVKSITAHNVIASLARHLLHYVGSYTGAKASQGLLDFHDLLLSARDLLKQHHHVRDYFRKRYRYLLVDEFQDTDPLQAEIIFYLSARGSGQTQAWQDMEISPGKLFLVGDPKQSIYRFRRADIEMYASARAALGEGHHLSIHQNFRCADSIVDVVNSVFEDLIKVPEDGNYQPEYVALDFGRDADTLPGHHGVILLYPPDTISGAAEKVGQRRLWESRSIAAFIQRIVEKERWEVWDKTDRCLRPIMLRDIAILMRTQTGLDTLEEALRLYDIDYRVVGGKRFFLTEEVQQLLAVLMAIDNPNDKVALVGAMRSPFFGISDEDLFLFHAGGGEFSYLSDSTGTRLEQAFGLLRRLHETRNEAGTEALLNTLYDETKTPVIFLLRPNGEQRVANLMKIGDMARALAERGLLTFRAFVRWLAERKEEEAEEAEAATVETGDDFVRLLTIHKAKGLEFPMVILTDLASRGNRRENFIVDRANREIGILLGAKAAGIQTANYDRLSDYEDLRREAEERRLLYVAMTRARDFVVVPAYFVTPREITKEGDPRPGSLLHYLVSKIPHPGELGEVTQLKGMHVFDTSKLDLEPREAPGFRITLDPDAPEGPVSESISGRLERWRERRVNAVARFARGRSLKTATEEKEILPGTESSEGAIFGKIVHGILERIDWSRPDFLNEIASEEASALGAGVPLVKRAVEMVRRTLSSDLIARIIAADRYYKEVPFAFKDNGTIVEGVIDVLFENKGRICIVDFKTDKVSKSGLKRRAEGYRTQVETYRRAVTAACGEPPEEAILFFLHPMETVVVSS